MQTMECSSLRVAFQRTEDRFRQSVQTLVNDTWIDVLSSQEGTPSVDWPPSPPWQQIVTEPIGPHQSDVLLGVGLSGSGHWSIAVNQSLGGILLDIACKLSKPAAFLGSTWLLAPDWHVSDSSGESMVLQKNASADGCIPAIQLTATLGTLSISPHNEVRLTPNSGLQPSTHRWAILIKQT